ncbi:MAG: isoleucine--tRNA ligase [Dehalococcoidales bacterium]|nr:isoleucine--tRNA ligase [Dehalococcoidales bacterium]
MGQVFKPVDTRISFPGQEEEILGFWKSEKIFEKSISSRKGGERFVFYEGPPTANGNPGIHHVISRVFKDVITRYKSMQGYYVPRIGGWDTHGLPVELEVEKELGFTSKTDIENYGIDRFNAKCRESVFKYLKEWNAFTDRIAFWVDLDNAYITMKNSYIESCWWAIKKMWDDGLVYKGYKTAAHCPRCGTSLSSHEVAQGYEENTVDPSVYIKFKLTPDSISRIGITEIAEKPVYLLAWTTTPWTLPGNTALAVDASARYALVEIDGYIIIAAQKLLATLELSDARKTGEISGQSLVGLDYEPLYNPHEFGVDRMRFKAGSSELEKQPETDKLNYHVISADFVSMDDGSGIVHIAPAFGEADFEAGKTEALDFVQHVDLGGKIIGNYNFTGFFVKDADKIITRDLDDRGLLYRETTITHTYPFCWRCSTPLLYYVKQSWYIRTTARKDCLIDLNQEINWYPDHIKNGRFGDWLQNNVDWAFSRERYWGTPLPVWCCEKCGSFDCIGGIEELKSKPGFSGFDGEIDLHRPYVDNLTYTCKCGGLMRRQTEVIDCWFDSGNMPIAQYHYPFDNNTLISDGRFPADFICEAIDQTRGWFYSLHAISSLLFNSVAYRNVICLGHILDEKGEKMSKSRKNVVQPKVIIDKYGTDAMRWYLYTASPPGQPRRFSEGLVGEVMRQFMLPLWNVYSFFVTYANIDNYNPVKSGHTSPVAELDRWILSELNDLVAKVTSDFDGYDPTSAGRRIEAFVSNLSNWYVRRSRRRFWKSENDEDKIAAYDTLHNCLETLSRLLAPFTPFLAEAMYQNLVLSVNPQAPESVHLASFPQADTTVIDNELAASVQLAIRICSLGRSARSQAGIKIRQPLSTFTVLLQSPGEEERLNRVKDQILEELNVKQVKVALNREELEKEGLNLSSDNLYAVGVDTRITRELESEGLAREIVRRIQTLRRQADFDIADHIVTWFQADQRIEEVMEEYRVYISRETLSDNIVNAEPDEQGYSENFKLDGHPVVLGVKKQD